MAAQDTHIIVIGSGMYAWCVLSLRSRVADHLLMRRNYRPSHLPGLEAGEFFFLGRDGGLLGVGSALNIFTGRYQILMLRERYRDELQK